MQSLVVDDTRQKNAIRSSAAAGGSRSTDGILLPFRSEPAALGFGAASMACLSRTKKQPPNRVAVSLWWTIQDSNL